MEADENLERLTAEEFVVVQAFRAADPARRYLLMELAVLTAARAIASKPNNVIVLTRRKR